MDKNLDDLKNVISAQGEVKPEGSFNIYEEYLLKYGKKPSYFEIHDSDSSSPQIYDYVKFKELLNTNFKNNRTIYKYISNNLKNSFIERECLILDDELEYMLNIDINKAIHVLTEEELEKLGVDKHTLVINSNYSYTPVEYKDDTINSIIQIFKDSKINYDIKRTSIEMVSISNGCFYAEDFYLKDDFVKFNFPDEHYGEGFEEFHESLINKLKTNSKGLILFHGEPGTGKTQYIRKLISDMSEKARVLYFSPAMISSVTNPEFIDFITDWSKADDEDKKRIIVLEDAEPLLENRNNNRNNGITNLLNLTSGLLSDILSIQYICTFNTNIEDIDRALLREERLTAIKKFDYLNKEQILNLIHHIEISEDQIDILMENKGRNELSLAEIYSIKNKNKIIQHGVTLTNKRIGFK